jgi:ElaB/YqjD/DUF883 family membrane-anchored ribosome-binding protein
MESNTNDTFGSQSSGESITGGSFGASTGSSSGTSSGTGSTGSNGFSRDTGSDAAGLADRAKSAASTAGDKLADVGSSVKERASGLKATLADALESGAEKLRQQGAGGGQIAGAAATGGSASMISEESNRLAATTNQLAGGLQASADWLRDADLDGLKSGIERQVKEHPGRSLAVAVGLGYLLGKAFRK